MSEQYPTRVFKCTDENFPPSLVSAWLDKIQEIAAPPETVLGDTGIEGLRLDFNSGLRLQVPGNEADSYRVVIGNAESGEVYFDEEVSHTVLVSFEKYFMPWQIEVFYHGEHIFSHTLDLDGQEVFFPFLTRLRCFRMSLSSYAAGIVGRVFPLLRTCAIWRQDIIRSWNFLMRSATRPMRHMRQEPG